MNYHEELKALLNEQKERYLTLENELKKSLNMSEALVEENRILKRSVQESEIIVKNSMTVIQNLEKELQEEKNLRLAEESLLTTGLMGRLKEWKGLAESLSLENSKQQVLIEKLIEKVGR